MPQQKVVGWMDQRFYVVSLNCFSQKLLSYLVLVLIGDKLASHFSIDVINACLQNDVRFIFFLPNTTYLCYPLDAAVFIPTKVLWQHILQSWRSEAKSKGASPKETSILKRVFTNLKSENRVSGFRACGIVPFNPE